MSRPARLVNLLALAAGALLVFALGFLAARCDPGEPVAATPEGGVRLLIDGGTIDLLPDASLHIDPLPGWDGGEPP
jgi:hypothetical protein